MTRTVSPFSTRVKISDAFFRNSVKDKLFIEGPPPSTRLYITHIDVQLAESLAGGIPSSELTCKVTFSRSTNLGLRPVQTVPSLRSLAWYRDRVQLFQPFHRFAQFKPSTRRRQFNRSTIQDRGRFNRFGRSKCSSRSWL